MNKLTKTEQKWFENEFGKGMIPDYIYNMTHDERTQYMYKIKNKPQSKILLALDPFWALTLKDLFKIWFYKPILKIKKTLRKRMM